MLYLFYREYSQNRQHHWVILVEMGKIVNLVPFTITGVTRSNEIDRALRNNAI